MKEHNGSFQKDLKNAQDQLWEHTFAEKKFYAYEFLRNQTIDEVEFDFVCPEVSFAIRIEPDKLTSIGTQLTAERKKSIEESGFKIIILSPEEIINQFDQTLSLLDKEFTSLARFQCG